MLTTLDIEKEETTVVRIETQAPSEYELANLPVVEGQKLRTGVPVVAEFMPAGALIPDNYDIPTYDPRTGRGYQRPLQESRVNELVADLKKGRVDLRPRSCLIFGTVKHGMP
jgi:hypothetical protein